MSELVIPVGNKGDRLKLESDKGVLFAVLNPGEVVAVISRAESFLEIIISGACVSIGSASFFGLSPPQIDAVRAWLTEQGHEFVDAAAEVA